jgi:hypothetical protein
LDTVFLLRKEQQLEGYVSPEPLNHSVSVSYLDNAEDLRDCRAIQFYIDEKKG